MNGTQLVDRYLKGNPLTRAERAALAKQLKSATVASKAISYAKQKAAEACHDWQPVDPPSGWVAFCYVKYAQVWRVLRDGEIVKAYKQEGEARKHAARLATDVNAEYKGKIANPDAKVEA